MILLMIVKKNTLSHLLGGANARGGEVWSEVKWSEPHKCRQITLFSSNSQ